MSTLQELKQAGKFLSFDERIELSRYLLLSDEEMPVNPEVEAAWEAEIQKRIESVNNGTAKTYPAPEAFALLKQALSKPK